MFLISSFFLLITISNILSKNIYYNYLKKEDFQTEIDGKKVELFFLTNKNGYELAITNYGGIIVSIMVPNKNNQFENIVQGYASLKEYIQNQKKGEKINSLLGRYSNEIKNNEFILENKTYKVNALNYSIFGERVWAPVQINSSELRLYHTSEDGENGFPGKLHIEVVYNLNDDNDLKISYSAITTKKTVINISQRLFVNLEGNFNSEIKNHFLSLNSKLYLPTDKNKIPFGDIKSVENTLYDFNGGKNIGEKNLDNYFVLDKKNSRNYKNLVIGGILQENRSGRMMEISTSEPGLKVNSDKYGISIEAMHFPNSPNVGFFPSTMLKAGDIYRQETIYHFDVRKD